MRTLPCLAIVALLMAAPFQAHATTLTTYDFSGAWLRGTEDVVTRFPRQPFSGTLVYPIDLDRPNGSNSLITLDLFDDQSNVSTFGLDTPLFAQIARTSQDRLLLIGGGVVSPSDTRDAFVDPPIETLLGVDLSLVVLTFRDETGALEFTRSPPDEIIFSDFDNFGGLRLETPDNREFLSGFIDRFELRATPTPIPLPPALPLLAAGLAALACVSQSGRRRARHNS